MTNEDRALLAQDALEVHPDYALNDMSENITDLLTNLMHLCDHYDEFGFESCLESARMHYEVEKDEEKGG